jgi:predicted permease
LLQQFITEGLLLSLTGVASGSGVLLALAPVMYTRVRQLATTRRDGDGRGVPAVGQHVRRGLATIEVALAVTLVTGAALLLRTVYNLTNVDAGFEPSQLVTFSLPPATYSTAVARLDAYERILRGVRGVPGVHAATAMAGLPPNRPLNATFTDIPNHPNPPGVPAETVDYFQFVMSDYFDTLGIPIVRGRTFQATDAAANARVAIVNEPFVNTFRQGQDPIGQRFRLCCNERIPWTTVIGVAGDVKQGGVDRTAGTEAYVFLEQSGRLRGPAAFAPETMHVVARTASTAAALSKAIDDVVRGTDPTVPVVRLRDMDGVYADAIRRPRLLAQLLGGFAGLALVLAAIGTYGVLSFIVAARRREIGIRLALGAERGNVLVHVMKQGFVLITLGLAAGFSGAFAVNRLIASLLFGVEPTDGPTFAAVGVAITMVAAAAWWLPPWRASRLDPATVLRET